MNLESLNPVNTSFQSATNLDLDPDPVLVNKHDQRPTLECLAAQHDSSALTELINQHLVQYSLQVADIEFKTDLLQLSLESAEVPDATEVIPLVHDYLSRLRLPNVRMVTIYGQKLHQELPFWMETIELDLLIIDPPLGCDASVEFEWEKAQSSLLLSPPNALPSEAVLQLTQKYKAGERNFAQINLQDEALPGVNLTLTDLQEANLVWCDLSKASFCHANLTSAELRHANLTGANLQGAKLQGTDLQGANLQGANLSWATLRGTNLTDADLTDVNLQNAILERVIMPDGTILD